MPDSDLPETGPNSPPTPDLYKFLENEIAFQRARKQEVFAWASSLLVAIIGGVILLTNVNSKRLDCWQKGLLSGVVLILCVVSYKWIEVHWKEYLGARRKLSYYYNQIAPDGRDNPYPHDFTGILAICLLGLAAIGVIWFGISH